MGKGHGTCCKRIVACVLGAAIVAVIVGVSVVYAPKHKHKDIDDGLPKVTNEDAFKNGGAVKHVKNSDGKDDSQDAYTLYQGAWDKFPKEDDWASFDHMWESNLGKIKKACKDHGWGDENSYVPTNLLPTLIPKITDDPGSDEENDMIKSQIDWVSRASLVDPRFILAVVLQESKGCLRVDSTKSVNGVHNPGLMQSHSGSSYNPSDKKNSIRQMLEDGTQGTHAGDGLVQTLNKFGNAYSAARGYNSGDVGASGTMEDGIGATNCYVSDVANRLMGWVQAENKCNEDSVGEQQSSGTDGQKTDATPSGAQNSQQDSPSTATSGASTDGTFTGGHWDINGNYVKGGGGGRKRRVVLRG